MTKALVEPWDEISKLDKCNMVCALISYGNNREFKWQSVSKQFLIHDMPNVKITATIQPKEKNRFFLMP
jgi:hypothetical protein